MKLENIKFRDKLYNLSFSHYASSNFIAILMGEPNDEYPDIITTNNSEIEKVGEVEYVQIRSDQPEYAQLLIENGLIEENPTFAFPQGYYISILFFAPTEEFANYIKENVKQQLQNRKKVNDDSIFIKYDSLTFLCDFELKKLEFIFKTDVPITSPTPAKANSLLSSLNKFKEPYVQLGCQVAHIEFIYIPNNAEERKSALKEFIENYS